MSKLQNLSARLTRAQKQYESEQFESQRRYIAEVKIIHEQKIQLIKKQSIRCSFCVKQSHLGSWGYIQSYLGVPARGYIEKASWSARGVRVCYLVCPRCSTRNYIAAHPQHERIIELLSSQGCALKEIFTLIWGQYGSQELRQIYPVL